MNLKLVQDHSLTILTIRLFTVTMIQQRPYTINLFNNVMLLEICSNFANFTPGQRFSLANFNPKLTQQSLPLLGFLECNTLLTHAVPMWFSLMLALLLTTFTSPLAFTSHRFTLSSIDAEAVNGHHSISVRNPWQHTTITQEDYARKFGGKAAKMIKTRIQHHTKNNM